jgi:hypothetical protein
VTPRYTRSLDSPLYEEPRLPAIQGASTPRYTRSLDSPLYEESRIPAIRGASTPRYMRSLDSWLVTSSEIFEPQNHSAHNQYGELQLSDIKDTGSIDSPLKNSTAYLLRNFPKKVPYFCDFCKRTLRCCVQ